jgi:hypothetical protein
VHLSVEAGSCGKCREVDDGGKGGTRTLDPGIMRWACAKPPKISSLYPRKPQIWPFSASYIVISV